ncbi:MAG: DUF2202 domain-containing protein [Mesotoga sp.]|uniref:DUF2202 domain-containing protein n=1 Tax=Mesotoga sp. TaxID=2053577 RepID=UPI00262D00EA|nr:DUF2202 domain-containing protein [Mesotoga sp.]MCP5457743.1 DUF2202 domain-containing protein [Thermotogota bacterium]MDD2333727.1 DUF2202 domain-containing protein [Mesotoga sp.]MDD3681260.1 DUF2202 domain-containing protein [Mesotoga sp.]MDD4207443.1 DUF2202 domain-containing protein [Mesotoga sp.]MDD4826483.1 DUF2202 domain-containing protein [Mesotoga sp.]
MKRVFSAVLMVLIIGSMSLASGSMTEEDGIAFMREEEKLAHDVYTVLHEIWGLNVFGNIARSEQTHTEAVLSLIGDFGMVDPVGENEIGVFTNSTLQELYDELIESGSKSLLDAVKVGLLIEEIDIKDLEELLEGDIDSRTARVYENLLRGSENHLRSFLRQYERLAGSYTPEVLDVERFNEIASGR